MDEQEKREKVIKGLECCVNDLGECEVCPYDEGMGKLACGKNLYSDAIALLKEREPVKPKKNDVELAGLRTWDWACPECDCILIYRANYCSCCGRAVKWDG